MQFGGGVFQKERDARARGARVGRDRRGAILSAGEGGGRVPERDGHLRVGASEPQVMIGREARLLDAATAFLTRLPLSRSHTDDELNHSARYFPLVGAAVGELGAAVTVAAARMLPAALA